MRSPDTSGWAPDHPVLEVLRRRRDGGHPDGHRVGLAVEGGGMRGIVSAAMLCAIEEAGFADAFDAVYACSSGAMNAAYFLARNTRPHLSIYYEDLATRRFVDFRRALRGRPILDLDYAFEVVVERAKPLDFAAVLRSATEFHVAVTDVDALATVDAREFASREDLKQALRATTWLPIAVPGTTTWRGRRAVDGGVLITHPYALARDDGCTHILSLSTRATHRSSPLARRLVRGRLNRLRDGLGDGYDDAVRGERAERRAMRTQMRHPVPGPYLLDLAPPPGANVQRHELRPARLLAAARSAYRVMRSVLAEGDPGAWDDLRPVAPGGRA